MNKDNEPLSIYIDESGYTGYNYLDERQPIFVMASSDIDPTAAEEILKNSFPKYQASEYKFSNIWNSTNQKHLFDVFQNIEKLEGKLFVYVIDKYFAVLVKMVDWLIEPQITNAGYDFYKNAYNRKLVNHIHFGLTEIEQINILPKMVVDYQEFSRRPNLDNLQKLQQRLEVYRDKVSNIENRQYLHMMRFGVEQLPKERIDEFKSTNELHLTTMLAIISWWRKQSDKDFMVYHDESSNFNRGIDDWYAITNPHVKPFLHPLGDGSYVQYPLRVKETYSVNSQDNYSIQLSDIVAGVFSKIFSKNNKPLQVELLNKIRSITSVSLDGVLPGTDFPENGPELKNGSDAVDNIANLIALRR